MPIHNRILYIGPYREFSGAGNSARNYIEALHKAGHDVCIVPIFSTGDLYPENDISSEILPLENNFLKSYDIVIQHCHPFDYVYDHRFAKNIGIYQFNSLSINPGIYSRLDILDKIIVNSRTNYNTILNKCSNQLENKIYIVPELINTKLKENNYIRYEWLPSENRPYVFYANGDFIGRKNLPKIIMAFMLAFDKDDNVELLIKTKPHHSHNNPSLMEKELDYEMNKIYGALRREKLLCKQPKIMIGKFNYNSLLSMHYNGDCYIDISMGENFGYGVLEAALFNNDIIVNSNSSSAEIVNCYKVDADVININDPFTKNFVESQITDRWSDVDFNHLVEQMKNAEINRYSNKKEYDISKYDFSIINELIC